MKKLMTILVLILFATIVTAQDEYVEWAKKFSKMLLADGGDDYHGLIVKQAHEKWGNDYEMVSYTIKNQCKAFYDHTYMEKPDRMPEGTFNEINVEAMVKWTKYNSDEKLIEADWEMILYETKNQIEAYLEIF